MRVGAAPDADRVQYANALGAAAKAVGVNFIGGFGALVHKGFSAGDKRLIKSIPRALAETELVCSSINVGSTKSGINMDAVALMGRVPGFHRFSRICGAVPSGYGKGSHACIIPRSRGTCILPGYDHSSVKRDFL